MRNFSKNIKNVSTQINLNHILVIEELRFVFCFESTHLSVWSSPSWGKIRFLQDSSDSRYIARFLCMPCKKWTPERNSQEMYCLEGSCKKCDLQESHMGCIILQDSGKELIFRLIFQDACKKCFFAQFEWWNSLKK